MVSEVSFNSSTAAANSVRKTGNNTTTTSTQQSGSVFLSQTATRNKEPEQTVNYDAMKVNLNKKYGKDFCDNVNKNIKKIANHPKVKKAMEKYKNTPLYKDIQLAFQGDEQAILRVLSDKNIQKDIDELLKDKDIQESIIDIAPTEDMKKAVKNLLNDEEIKKQVFDIANGKNVDENVKSLMENSKVQDFVKSILSDPEIKELIKARTKDFPMKNKLFDCLDNPIVQFGLVKTIMSNEVVQKTIAHMIKTGDMDSLDAAVSEIKKSLMQSNNFLNNTATILQVGLMGGVTVGAAAGDVVGSYIPVIGKPIFSTVGAVTGGVLGGVAGILGSIGYGIARPFIRDAVLSK